jgi:hypothetical protein
VDHLVVSHHQGIRETLGTCYCTFLVGNGCREINADATEAIDLCAGESQERFAEA